MTSVDAIIVTSSLVIGVYSLSALVAIMEFEAVIETSLLDKIEWSN